VTRRTANPNRVSPWVLAGIAAGIVLSAFIAVITDAKVSKEDIGAWADILLFVLPALGVGGGAAWGAQRATKDVTPVLTDKGDVPRDLQGRELRPAGHDLAGGYPPTRAVLPEDRRPFDGP